MSRPCLFELHAREKAGLSDTWLMYRWEALPHYKEVMYYEIEGIVTTETYKSGPRKGRPNYSKGDKETERTVLLSVADHEAFRQRWSRETGNCLTCLGTGQEWRGWSQEGGHRYRECVACGGTGKCNGTPVDGTKGAGE